MPVAYDSDSGGATTRKPKRLKKTRKPKAPRGADTGDRARSNPAPAKPPEKVRQFAHPNRKEPQKVIGRETARVQVEATKRAATRKAVRKIKVTPVPSPDARDSTRTPAQRSHDAAAVARNIGAARKRGAENRKLAKVGATRSPDGKLRIADHEKFKEAGRKQTAASFAPVLRVLEETTRINHAIAGAADAAVTGKDISKAAVKGLKNESKTTFSDVLGHAGVENKTVKGVGGFALDVGTDPTTYVTFGVKSAAAKAAESAAKSAEKAALKSGLSKEQAARMGARARTQAERKGDQAKGVAVKFAGKEVPGVRKATAGAAKPVRASGRKVAPKRVRDAARAVGADLNPNVAPTGVAKKVSDEAIAATRTARAKINRGTHEAQQHAHGIREQVGEANYSRIIDAIENGTIAKLPAELREVAIRVRSQFRHANRQRKQAGIRGGEIKARKQVKVPEVTADVGESAKTLGKSSRERASAERAVRSAESRHGIYQGRAEVLSRNVSGVRGEKAAEGGRNTRKTRSTAKQVERTERRALAHGLTPMQAQSAANRVAQQLRAPKYAAGGKGVRDTAAEVKAAEQRLKDATAAHEANIAAHGTTKLTAAAQRKARETALETNAKRKAAPKEYIPHKLTGEALEATGRTSGGAVGRKVIRPASSKARADNRPLSVLRDEAPGKYSEDLADLYANRKTEGATAVARAELNRRIADLGRPVKKGADLTLEQGESVYHITGSDLRKVTDKKELGRLVEEGGKSGRFVVLNDDVVKRAVEGSQPTMQGPGIVRGLDKVQGGFKRLALATPGFHVRNLIGDTQNAYLGQNARRIPKNMVDAGRVLKAEGRGEKALRTLKKADDHTGTIKTGRYGKVTYDEVARQLKEHGAMRSGYTARELPELSKGRIQGKLPRNVKQAFLNREDLPRLTTAVEALKNGATWEQAARRVADYHFDYAHLTNFERQVARRAAPFYTFTARNIPLQFKSLAKKPGKFANYQKLIESASKATGMDDEAKKARALTDQLRAAGVKLPDRWESSMGEWEQRNAGIPISHRGMKFTVSFGLPLTSGLNEIPGAAGKGQINEYFRTAMSLVTPVVKNPVEYFNNYSFFFRDQIQRENSPLVSAPSYVAGLPAGTRKSIGAVQSVDKRTGKVIWKWPGKVDYIVKTIPGLPQYAQQLATEGTNRRGKGTGGKVLQLFGVRAEPFDPVRTATNLAYARQQEIQTKLAALRDTKHPRNNENISAKNPTPEYERLNAQLKLTTQIAYQGKDQQGYKVLPTQGGPPKVRSSSGRVRLNSSAKSRVKLGGGSTGRVRLGG